MFSSFIGQWFLLVCFVLLCFCVCCFVLILGYTLALLRMPLKRTNTEPYPGLFKWDCCKLGQGQCYKRSFSWARGLWSLLLWFAYKNKEVRLSNLLKSQFLNFVFLLISLSHLQITFSFYRWRDWDLDSKCDFPKARQDRQPESNRVWKGTWLLLNNSMLSSSVTETVFLLDRFWDCYQGEECSWRLRELVKVKPILSALESWILHQW